MFRIVFTTTCPRTRMRVIDNGPWHPTRERAQQWLEYFSSLGHAAKMTLEGAALG